MKFLLLYISILPQIAFCQTRLSASAVGGLNQTLFRSVPAGVDRFSTSAILGLEAGILYRARIGLNCGYNHAQIKEKVKLPETSQKLGFSYSIRHFPISLEFVIWKDSKDLYSRVFIVPDQYISIKIGSFNVYKQLAFGQYMNAAKQMSQKQDIDQFTSNFNQKFANQYKMQTTNMMNQIDFFKSPFVALKWKFKDRKGYCFTLEAIYGINTIPSNDIIIVSAKNDFRYTSSFTTHVFSLRANVLLFYDSQQ